MVSTYEDSAPIDESIETVGELREFLEGFDSDMSVRVNDDGRTMRVKPRRRKGKGGLFLEL